MMLPLLSFPFPLLPFAPWAHSHLPTNRSFTRFPNNTSFPLTLSTYSLLVPSLGSYCSVIHFRSFPTSTHHSPTGLQQAVPNDPSCFHPVFPPLLYSHCSYTRSSPS